MFRHRWLAVVGVVAVVLAQDEWVAAQETAPRPNASDNLTPDTNPGERKQQIAERDRRWEQADQLAADGKTAEAIQAGEHVLTLERKLFGQTHAELTGTLEWLAQRYLEQADTKQAEERAVELLRVQESLHGKDHWQSASARWYLDYLRKVAQVEPPTLVKMLVIEAEYNRLYADGKYAEAAKKIQELVPFEQQALGDDHPFFANTWSLRADCLLEAGEFAAAETAAERALQIRRRKLGDKHPDTAGAAWSLAQSRIRQEKHAEALASLLLARDAWGSAGQEEDAAWMDSWRGDSLAAMERNDEAKDAYQAALAAFRAMGHAEGEAQHLVRLADLDGSVDLQQQRDLLWDQAQQARSDRKLADAATLGERMLAVERAWLGDDNGEVTSSLAWLAEVYEAAENWPAAEAKRREVLTRKTETLGEQNWQVTDARLALEHVRRLSSLTPAQREQLAEATGLAGVVTRLHDAGKYDRALEPARQALALRTNVLGAEHRQTATSLNNLAGLYRASGDYSKAEPLYGQALDIRKKVLGEKHPDTAQVAWFLALSRIRQKKHAEALASLVLARDAWRSAGREENAAWMDSQRGDGLAAMERNDEAQAAYQAALAAFRAMGNAEGEARQLIRLADLDGSIDLEQQRNHLLDQARQARSDRKLADAATLGERMLALERVWLGDDDVEVTSSLQWLAAVYEAAENWPAAEAKRREVLTRRTETLGEKDWQVTDARLALEDVRRLSSLTPPQRKQVAEATGLNSEFVRLHDAGQYGRALEAARQALALRSRVLGAEHPQTATSLNNLALLYYEMGGYTKAEPLYQQALNIRKKILGEEHPAYAVSLNNLAQLYWSMGDYAQAEPLYRQARDLRKKVLGEEHADYATSLNGLAVLYWNMGDYAQAEPLFRQALGILKEVHGEAHPYYATSLNNLALLYFEMGDHAQAEPLYRQALNIRRKVRGEEHPDYAQSLNNLAFFYFEMGDHAQAETLYRQARDIRKKVLGEEHPDYASSLNKLAMLHLDMGDHTKAEPLFRQALNIRKKVLGEEHTDYASSLNNLALLYFEMGDYAQAEPLYRKALDIDKKVLGEEHPSYATSLNNLAGLYEGMGDYAQAEPLHRQALDLRKKVLGEEHSDYATSLNNLAAFYYQMGDYAQSEPLARQALATSRDLLEDSALVLSERQQLAMNQMLRYRLDGYLSLALKSGNYHVSAAQEALRWKGATLVRQRAMRLAADDPAVADGFRQLQQVARQLASLSRATPGENLVGWRERIAKLTAEKETLEAQLSRDSDAFREATRDVTLEQIQAALPDGGVLVDYLEFGRSRPAEQKGQWDGERSLLAIVVPRRAQPRLIELGPVAPIATAIDTWRQTFGRSPQAIAAGQALRERLWEPVLDGLEAMAATADEETGKNACRTILVSTDGVLGRLPLGALPGKQPDTYLIEDHRLAMIPVPQLLPALVNDSGQKELSRRLLMVGDVDFDAQPQAEPTKRRRRRRAVGVDARFTPLPGTRDEILALNDLYRRKFGTDDDGLHTLRGSDANEARFRQLAPQFYHLHLATHGFFAPAEVPSALSDGAIESAGKRSMLISGERQVVGHNPGLLSGLAFAGANRDPVEDADDGILTAQEIAFLTLGGVDTVVLSACDTGLGEVAGGEGLLGVQRSFQIAGARTTVASLWKVDDTVTVRLMDRFYSNLWKEEEMSRLDALREAQLWVLHHPDCVRGATTIRGATPSDEETPDRVPSYYWAAFVLSGDWR